MQLIISLRTLSDIFEMKFHRLRGKCSSRFVVLAVTMGIESLSVLVYAVHGIIS